MKKRTLKVIIALVVFLAVFISAYFVWNNGKEANTKEEWTEKTINKESMKTDADCGIVSVKMLLDFYNIHVSYEELKRKLNTTAEGTNWKDIKEYLQTIDNVEMIDFKDNLSKANEYLENGYPLFICWDVDEKPEWSHYSILIAIDNHSVWMLDPEEKKSLTEYSLDYFLPCWKNENYWFCILEVSSKKKAIQEQVENEIK